MIASWSPLQAAEGYEIVERDGYHDPRRTYGHGRGCGCRPHTDGDRACRDVVTERTGPDKAHEWDRVRYYHQSPVVRKNADRVRVDTHGYSTSSTTRERINQELAEIFMLRQENWDLVLELPNGATVPCSDSFTIDFEALGPDWGRVRMEGNRENVDFTRA